MVPIREGHPDGVSGDVNRKAGRLTAKTTSSPSSETRSCTGRVTTTNVKSSTDRVGGWELQGSGDTWVVCNTCYMAVELGASVAHPYAANSDPRPSRVTVVPGEPTRRKHVRTRE